MTPREMDDLSPSEYDAFRRLMRAELADLDRQIRDAKRKR